MLCIYARCCVFRSRGTVFKQAPPLQSRQRWSRLFRKTTRSSHDPYTFPLSRLDPAVTRLVCSCSGSSLHSHVSLLPLAKTASRRSLGGRAQWCNLELPRAKSATRSATRRAAAGLRVPSSRADDVHAGAWIETGLDGSIYGACTSMFTPGTWLAFVTNQRGLPGSC